ncbi:MAG: hypothetical protein H8E42_11650 [Nitrospinae bacterium]|nr:hypothetical protein [Nitrospinota bacterium]MBL7019636.1 hypothetical protein [Nitrospinaceae bacterium]
MFSRRQKLSAESQAKIYRHITMNRKDIAENIASSPLGALRLRLAVEFYLTMQSREGKIAVD